jgi:hypothetical protein
LPTCRNNLAYVGHLSASLAHATAEANRQSPSNFAKTGSNKSNRPLGLIDAAVMANAVALWICHLMSKGAAA